MYWLCATVKQLPHALCEPEEGIRAHLRMTRACEILMRSLPIADENADAMRRDVEYRVRLHSDNEELDGEET